MQVLSSPGGMQKMRMSVVQGMDQLGRLEGWVCPPGCLIVALRCLP